MALIDIEKARRKLAQRFFHTHPNRWVNGVAVDVTPPPAPEGDRPRQRDKKPREHPHVVIFVNPSTPGCEVCCIEEACQETKQPFRLLHSSRFVGLAASGDSISPYTPDRYNVPAAGVGTLGGFLEANGKQYLLGSNHVLAYNGRVHEDKDVRIRGAVEDVGGGTLVARFSCFVPLVPSEWPSNLPAQGSPPNRSDCALAELTQPVSPPSSTWREVKPLALLVPGSNTPKLDSSVLATINQKTIRKHGRTTQNTSGAKVTIHLWEGPIDFSFGAYYFEQMVGTEVSKDVFAAPGDSGSVAVLDDPSAGPSTGVGLLTARSFVVDPSNHQFQGYIFLMCTMQSVAQDLAKEMQLTANQLAFFM